MKDKEVFFRFDQLGLQNWVKGHYLQLGLFNLFLMFLILMRSAGYFDPFLMISVNLIIILALLGSVVLLGARSRAIFLIGLLFWLFAGFLRLVKIEVWAERTSVYVYQSLLIGLGLYIIEQLSIRKKKKR